MKKALTLRLLIGVVVVLAIGSGIYFYSQSNLVDVQSSGKIRVLFKKDAALTTIKSQFSSIGVSLTDAMFESDKTLVATPHRDQAKLYGDKLSKYPLVKSIDYSETDDNLSQFHEKIKNDAAYLYITFVKPMKSDDVLQWLKTNYPDLVDVSIQDKSKTLSNTSNGLVTVINTQTGQESYGGVNPWTDTLLQTVIVPNGQEAEYLQKILAFSTVDSAAIVRIIQRPPCKDISCAGDNGILQQNYPYPVK